MSEATSSELERSGDDALPPRMPVTDDNVTTLQLRTLNAELTCPVCLGILHNTMTVMQCLHRFCAACISKSLRLGKKECPTCRAKCSSTRHLRRDTNMDGIIAAIYPNLEDYEAKEEALIRQINQRVMRHGALIDSVEQGKRRQALAKPPRPPKLAPSAPSPSSTQPTAAKKKAAEQAAKESRKRDRPAEKAAPPAKKAAAAGPGRPPAASGAPPTSTPAAPGATAAAPAARVNQGPEISFEFVPHVTATSVPALQNKYLRTSRQITIRHLCKFLAKKLNMPDLPDSKPFRITVNNKVFQPLADDFTLDRIDREIWKRNQELILYYRLGDD